MFYLFSEKVLCRQELTQDSPPPVRSKEVRLALLVTDCALGALLGAVVLSAVITLAGVPIFPLGALSQGTVGIVGAAAGVLLVGVIVADVVRYRSLPTETSEQPSVKQLTTPPEATVPPPQPPSADRGKSDLPPPVKGDKKEHSSPKAPPPSGEKSTSDPSVGLEGSERQTAESAPPQATGTAGAPPPPGEEVEPPPVLIRGILNLTNTCYFSSALQMLFPLCEKRFTSPWDEAWPRYNLARFGYELGGVLMPYARDEGRRAAIIAASQRAFGTTQVQQVMTTWHNKGGEVARSLFETEVGASLEGLEELVKGNIYTRILNKSKEFFLNQLIFSELRQFYVAYRDGKLRSTDSINPRQLYDLFCKKTNTERFHQESVGRALLPLCEVMGMSSIEYQMEKIPISREGEPPPEPRTEPFLKMEEVQLPSLELPPEVGGIPFRLEQLILGFSYPEESEATSTTPPFKYITKEGEREAVRWRTTPHILSQPPPYLMVEIKRNQENRDQPVLVDRDRPLDLAPLFPHAESTSSRYRLVGAALHDGYFDPRWGSIGHYVAYSKRGEAWFYCNDTWPREYRDSDYASLTKACFYIFERLDEPPPAPTPQESP